MRGEDTLARGGGRGRGVNSLEDIRHWIGLLQYNPSTLASEQIIEIDTQEQHQTEKIETEVKDVDRIRAYTGVRSTIQRGYAWTLL